MKNNFVDQDRRFTNTSVHFTFFRFILSLPLSPTLVPQKSIKQSINKKTTHRKVTSTV